MSNLALSSADPWRPLNDGYAFQTCSDYSFDFEHRNHDSRQINLFVLFKDRRCLLLSRNNTISKQLTGVNIKTSKILKNRNDLYKVHGHGRALSLDTKVYLCYVSHELCLLLFIDLIELAWNKIQLG